MVARNARRYVNDPQGSLRLPNLMIDTDALSKLARVQGKSESAAARDAIARQLAFEGMAQALRELHKPGAFADFEKRFPPVEPLPPLTAADLEMLDQMDREDEEAIAEDE